MLLHTEVIGSDGRHLKSAVAWPDGRTLHVMTADFEARLEATRAELERLRLTLAVVGTMDLDVGVLNRNGVLDAIDRARKWQTRRGDVFGILVVRIPDIADSETDAVAAREVAENVAAVLAAGLREVDSVGRCAETTYAGVLSDLQPDSIPIVAMRLDAVFRHLVETDPGFGASYGIGAIEVHGGNETPVELLDRTTSMATEAIDDRPSVGRL